MIRKIIFVFLALTLALGIFAFSQNDVTHAAGVYPAPKRAMSITPLDASTCLASPSEANCGNQDPYDNTGNLQYACGADAVVIASTSFGSNGYVHLMWSNNCQSNWTIVGVTSGTASLAANTVRYDGSGIYEQLGYQSTGSYIWTNMIYAPTQLTCGEGFLNGGAGPTGVAAQSGYPLRNGGNC